MHAKEEAEKASVKDCGACMATPVPAPCIVACTAAGSVGMGPPPRPPVSHPCQAPLACCDDCCLCPLQLSPSIADLKFEYFFKAPAWHEGLDGDLQQSGVPACGTAPGLFVVRGPATPPTQPPHRHSHSTHTLPATPHTQPPHALPPRTHSRPPHPHSHPVAVYPSCGPSSLP